VLLYLGGLVPSSAIASIARVNPALIALSICGMLRELPGGFPLRLSVAELPLAPLLSSLEAVDRLSSADTRTDVCGNVTNPAEVFRPDRGEIEGDTAGIDTGTSGKAETISDVVVDVDDVPAAC